MRTVRSAMTVMLTMVATVAAVACGNDDTTDPPGNVDGAASDVAADGDPVDGPDDDVEELLDGLDFGDGAARVTSGDTTYEFAFGGNSTVGSTTYMGISSPRLARITSPSRRAGFPLAAAPPRTPARSPDAARARGDRASSGRGRPAVVTP